MHMLGDTDFITILKGENMAENIGGIKIESGEKREFNTGAKKQASTGKGTPVLFPPDAYLEISKHFEDGAAIYSPRNWEKGIPLGELINSCERHIAQEKMGLTDERHDRAFVWCAVVYLATKLRIQAGILPAGLADLCGVYVEKQEREREFEIDNIFHNCFCEENGDICDCENKWFIYHRPTEQYLRKDLKLYKSQGSTEFHPTREAAEEHLQKYLQKGGD